MAKRIALVEDDEVIRANYADLLTQSGYSVLALPDMSAALAEFDRALPDIVLLDITLSDEREAGFELCLELRRRSLLLPIIFLTSHDSDVDRISGLRLGADDYLTKDVSVEYLIVRIEALQRRLATVAAAVASGAHVGSGVEFPESLVMSDAESRAWWQGRVLDLTLTQYWMLRELIRNTGAVVSHASLMGAARIVVEQNTVTAHVKAIRDSFRRINPTFDAIHTERGRGYRWLGGSHTVVPSVEGRATPR
jgi:two-component system OmpR family response regulator